LRKIFKEWLPPSWTLAAGATTLTTSFNYFPILFDCSTITIFIFILSFLFLLSIFSDLSHF
jgi:hypothetical protein